MILQLFIFALAFVGFGIFSLLKKKKFVGWMFILLGFMLLVVAIITVYYYPHTLPILF
jgi:hypothetical protein